MNFELFRFVIMKDKNSTSRTTEIKKVVRLYLAFNLDRYERLSLCCKQNYIDPITGYYENSEEFIFAEIASAREAS